jgi:UDP-N-acetylglucosamine 2-epimerase (non-hydrolysing)
VQEETSYLGIPCLTLRENTERPVTVTLGTNRLVKVETVADDVARVLAGPQRTQCAIPLWDGKTAGRVVGSLRRRAGR